MDKLQIIQDAVNLILERSFANRLYAKTTYFSDYHNGRADAYELAALWLQEAIREEKGEI